MPPRSWWITRRKFMVWTKFSGKRILGNVCHWLVMKQSSIFKAQKSLCLLGFCVVPRKGSFNIRIPTKLGRTGLQESDPRKATEIMVLSMESRPNSSGTSSQDSQRCSSVVKSMIYWATWGQTPETFTGRLLFMSMFNDISCDRKGNNDECLANAETVKVLARRFGYWTMVIYWTRFWKRSGILQRIVHKELGIIIAEEMLLEFAESGNILLSVQRLHCPGVNSRAKDMENCRGHFAGRWTYNWNNFIALSFLSISSASTEQWQLYVKNLRAIKMDRGNLRSWWVQSIVLGEIKAEVSFAERKLYESSNSVATIHWTNWIAFTRK